MNHLQIDFPSNLCCQTNRTIKNDIQYEIDIPIHKPTPKILDLNHTNKLHHLQKSKQNFSFINQPSKSLLKQPIQQTHNLTWDEQQLNKQIKRKSILNSYCKALIKFQRQDKSQNNSFLTQATRIKQKPFADKKINVTCSKEKIVVLGPKRGKSFAKPNLSFGQNQNPQTKDTSKRLSLFAQKGPTLISNIRISKDRINQQQKNTFYERFQPTDKKTSKLSTIQNSKHLSSLNQDPHHESSYVQNFRNTHLPSDCHNQNIFTSPNKQNDINKENLPNRHPNTTIQQQTQIRILKREINRLEQNLTDLKIQEKQLLYVIDSEKTSFQTEHQSLLQKITHYHQTEKYRLKQIEDIKNLLIQLNPYCAITNK